MTGVQTCALPISADLYKQLRDREVDKLGGIGERHYRDVVEILDKLVLDENFSEFLTLPAYEKLIAQE